jgi:CheY-like chemotaxis protein
MSKNMTDYNSTIKRLEGHDQFLQRTTKRKILIVDDNKDLVKVLETALKIWGHEVRIATDGFSGIEIAHSFTPDVVILDIGMPGMDGYTACRVMHEDPKLKNTMFIAQTGWGSLEQQKRSRQAGFHYHLLKPFNLESLHNTLENKEKYMKNI